MILSNKVYKAKIVVLLHHIWDIGIVYVKRMVIIKWGESFKNTFVAIRAAKY